MLLPLYQLSYVTITNSTQFKPGNPSASPSSASPSGPCPSSFCNVIFKHLWETGNISVNICAQTENLLLVQTITNANCNQRFKIKTMTLLLSSLSPLWLQLWHYWVSCMLKYCLIILIQKKLVLLPSATTTILRPFFRTTRVSRCQKRTCGLYGARKD